MEIFTFVSFVVVLCGIVLLLGALLDKIDRVIYKLKEIVAELEYQSDFMEDNDYSYDDCGCPIEYNTKMLTPEEIIDILNNEEKPKSAKKDKAVKSKSTKKVTK